MKIFFTHSFNSQETHKKHYATILSSIQKAKAEVVAPMLGNYSKILTQIEMHSLKSEEQIHYEAIKRGIQWADAVIIEISHEDFQLGHEATLASLNRKPVLALSIHENFAEKINNKYFFGAKYTQYNVHEIISDFISRHRNELKSERFNFFLSKSQLGHLEAFGKRYDMNKSEYLRKLIEDDLASNRTN